VTPTDDEIARMEAARRWADVVRLLELRASAREVGSEARLDALLRMMRIYVDRFANHGLAVAAAERVLELDANHHEAIEYLRGAYKARRQFDKLAALEARAPKR